MKHPLLLPMRKCNRQLILPLLQLDRPTGMPREIAMQVQHDGIVQFHLQFTLTFSGERFCILDSGTDRAGPNTAVKGPEAIEALAGEPAGQTSIAAICTMMRIDKTFGFFRRRI